MSAAAADYGQRGMIELFKDLGGVVGPALLILLGLVSEAFRQLWRSRREQEIVKRELEKEARITTERAETLAREAIRDAERLAARERDRAQDVLREAEKTAREERDWTQKLLDREREDRQRELDGRQREMDLTLHNMRNKLQQLTLDLEQAQKRTQQMEVQHARDLAVMSQRLEFREQENAELMERVVYLEQQLALQKPL